MRILHYIDRVSLNDGGTTRAVLDMCTWLARSGVTTTLLTFDAQAVPAEWTNGVAGTPRVKVLDGNAGARALLSPALLEKAFAAHLRDVDVVHLHNVWDPAQIPLTRAARAANVPYVQSPHGMLADWSLRQKWLRKSIYRALFAQQMIDHAALVLHTAAGEAAQAGPRHPRTSSETIPLIFDLDPYRAAPTPDLARANLPLPPPEVPTLLYLSRLDYKKRPDLLLLAGRELARSGLDFRIIVAGPSSRSYLAKLQAYARRLGVSKFTHFLGMVPAEWKPSLLSACDLFVLPTSMENFGFVYFEALASGTPVLTTRGTDTWPELESSGAGTTVGLIKSSVANGSVGGGDVRELAAAMRTLLSDRVKLRERGAVGRAWVLDHMDPSHVVRGYCSMYERVAQRQRAGSSADGASAPSASR